MALLDSEDKQALRELAFGKIDKIKDKVWRAILLIGIVIILALGIIAQVRNHAILTNPWLLGGIYAAGALLILIILSLKVFKGMHRELRRFLVPLTVVAISYALFAIIAPVYHREMQIQCVTTPCESVKENYSFVGSPSL